jgi:hypothetical protein
MPMNSASDPAVENAGNALPPVRRGAGSAMAIGAAGFTAVSVAAFSVWAFGSGLFRGRGGEVALYAAVAGVFVALTGACLHPLVEGPRKIARFYAAFGPAFVAYSVVWSVFWFLLKFGAGEWLGAACGSAVFVAIIAWRFGRMNAFWPAFAVFFVLHTAGYFAGGKAMAWMFEAGKPQPPMSFDKALWSSLAKLSWGLFYGIGFGAGLGFVFRACQRPSR